MKQLQLYKYATWALLLVNLVLIVFLIMGRPPQGPPGRRGAAPPGAIDMLNFDEEQHRLFLVSVEQHEERLEAISEEQRVALQPYFRSILTDTDSTNYDSSLNKVQVLERAKIESLYDHFQDIKNLLRPEQEAAFKDFLEKIVNRNLHETKKKQRPPMEPPH